MKVHFVCLGNVYRSRLAEAYLNSKQIPDLTVISSGTVAAVEQKNRPISWVAQRLLDSHKLVPFQKLLRTQTTKELLDSADFTIFFTQVPYQYCVDTLGFSSKQFEIWDIADTNNNYGNDIEKMKITEDAFAIIRQKVDNFITCFCPQ